MQCTRIWVKQNADLQKIKKKKTYGLDKYKLVLIVLFFL